MKLVILVALQHCHNVILSAGNNACYTKFTWILLCNDRALLIHVSARISINVLKNDNLIVEESAPIAITNFFFKIVLSMDKKLVCMFSVHIFVFLFSVDIFIWRRKHHFNRYFQLFFYRVQKNTGCYCILSHIREF